MTPDELAFALDVFRELHRVEVEAAFRQGREVEAREYEALWANVSRPVANPEQYRREVADRNLRAAEAATRRDAAAWEASYVARAKNTAPRDRTAAQQATCHLYGTPPAKAAAA